MPIRRPDPNCCSVELCYALKQGFSHKEFGTKIALINNQIKEVSMLRAALAFFILALVAILFGANGIAGVSIEVGKMLLFVFLILAAVTAVIGLISGRSPRQLP
jgi:uncharacterized membrane protein YtjA (UPF0391 family)